MTGCSPLDSVRDRLEDHGCSPRGPNGKFEARCPAHDDRAPSLSVGVGQDGRVLLHCHAGCEPAEILAALGLSWADLYPGPGSNGNGHREIVATYDYQDEAGELLYQVVRYSPKTFRQRRPDGRGDWTWKLGGTRRVLYRLSNVVAAIAAGDRVYVVEGEKDVHALERAGATATCNAGGAGKWRPEYAEVLRGAKVTIIADRDKPGREHARKIAASLHGVALEVAVVEPAVGKDAADHLAAGKSIDEFAPAHSAPSVAPKAGGSEGTADEAVGASDLSYAEALAREHGETLRYVRGMSWLVWDGRRWAPGDDAAREAAKGIARARAREAVDAGDAKAAKAALSRCDEPKIRGSLTLAETEPALAVRADQLDAHPLLLCAQNGVVDLRTGAITAHDPKLLMTKMAGAEYIEGAHSERWGQLLGRATGGDIELVAFLQRAAGYSATGLTTEEVALFLHGPGASGKTTFVEALRAALGDYAMTADFAVFLAGRGGGDGATPGIARLAGARLVVASEVAAGQRFNLARLKSLTGGERITARRLYRDPFEFAPAFTLWLAANDRPAIPASDDAAWRRIRLVPFTNVVPAEERDPEMKRALISDPGERAAVLAWVVEGAAAWHAEGLGASIVVDAATSDYRVENDAIAEWLGSRCELAPDAEARGGELRRDYEQWCQESGEEPCTPREWGAALRAHDLEKKPGKRGKVWRGVRIGVTPVTPVTPRTENSPTRAGVAKVPQVGSPGSPDDAGGPRRPPTRRHPAAPAADGSADTATSSTEGSVVRGFEAKRAQNERERLRDAGQMELEDAVTTPPPPIGEGTNGHLDADAELARVKAKFAETERGS